MVEQICAFALLAISAIQDIKGREISMIPLLFGCVMGVIYQCYGCGLSIGEVVGGASIGIGLILMSIVSDQQVGLGDGFVLVGTGLFIGIWDNLFILMVGLVAIGIVAAVLYISHAQNKEYELPFIPFLCGADLLLLTLKAIK